VKQAWISFFYLHRSRWKRQMQWIHAFRFLRKSRTERRDEKCLFLWNAYLLNSLLRFSFVSKHEIKILEQKRSSVTWAVEEVMQTLQQTFLFKTGLLWGKSVRTKIMSISLFYVVSSHMYHSPLTEDFDSTWFNSWEMQDLWDLKFYRD
jgi:hypothetical protein